MKRICNSGRWVGLAPRGVVGPGGHGFGGPVGGFIGVADSARIGDGGLFGRDEFKCVAADVDVRDGLLDFRHVAVHAQAALAIGAVMRMGFEGCSAGAVGPAGNVARQAHGVGGFAEVRVVRRAVNVVATEAGDAVQVHFALHEIVALHAVLVRRVVGEMGERGLAQFVFFELPVVLEL
jgi:hypothetical protein